MGDQIGLPLNISWRSSWILLTPLPISLLPAISVTTLTLFNHFHIWISSKTFSQYMSFLMGLEPMWPVLGAGLY
jgi:hypothetical protein